jgi:AcrR family transcriptional regulator
MKMRTTIEELRRAELIDATVRMIAERGFDGTTIRDIARAAGASPASVMYYFDTKTDLLAVSFAESDARFRARVREATDGLSGVDCLRRIIECCFPDDSREDPAWNVEIDLWALAARRDDFREIFETASADWLSIIETAYAEAMQGGGGADLGGAREAAMALAAQIDGLAVHTRVTKHIDAQTARRILHRQIDSIASGNGRKVDT